MTENQGFLSKDIEDLMNQKKIQKCAVQKLIDKLVEKDLKAFSQLLESEVTNIKISELLKKNNILISDTSIGKHRRNRCACTDKL